MYSIDKLFNCGIFQGANKRKHYFEGWYFKHVDKGEQNVISIIPGVSIEEDASKSHAFIQILDGSTYKTYYIRYDIEEFKFSKKSFEFTIGNNSFSDKGIELNIETEDIVLQGRLVYSKPIHWPSGITSPNSMGWYAYIPIMECYHGVLSLKHNIFGQIKLNNRMIHFDGGIGYMEKDWGTSFPSSWIWLQSNHFETENTSLMLSIAKIPWRQKSFLGVLSALWHDNKLYRFTTYTGSKIDYLQLNDRQIIIQISDESYNLYIEAVPGESGSLQAPVKGAMTGNVMESISGIASLKLRDKKTGKVILEGKAHCCGMEIGGNTQELITLP
jgi:tocopherol cyclase